MMSVVSNLSLTVLRHRPPSWRILSTTPWTSILRAGGCLGQDSAMPSSAAPCHRSMVVRHSSSDHQDPVPRHDRSLPHWNDQPQIDLRDDGSGLEPDPEGDLAIYKGILSTQIKLVKTFSLMTSAIGLAFQPVLFVNVQSGQNVGVFLAAGAFFSFFTFVTPLLIHAVSKKYVTELYYNKKDDSYTAVTISLLLRPKKLKFHLNDVRVPDIPGMFTTFKAKDVPLFVDGQQFYVPRHYGKLMGLDKPLDLRLRSDSQTRDK